ncbi:MAG: hypothetical protein QOJ11_1441 [Frankiales bacterium]|jgi:hypothetical protein|nr:hypothetical protein [Frankiales bacterium]
MTFARRAWIPAVVAALMFAPATSASASTAAPSKDTKAVVDLTFDLTVGLLGASMESTTGADGQDAYVPDTFSRPTDAPLPKSSPITQLGLKLTPGTTMVVSVFSVKSVNDNICMTATSTRTPTVVYLSTKTLRPSLKRPHGCAKPGHKPMVTPPSKSLQGAQFNPNLYSDLKTVSIAEQSYATDNNGAYVADIISRPTKAGPPTNDVLVQQGALINVGDTVVATLFTTDQPNDSYCLKGTSTKTKQVLYLSSVNDTVTKHRPKGCITS